MNQLKNNTKKSFSLKNEDGKDAWWVILLKVLAYAIGLIIAGIGTVEAASMLQLL